MIIKFTPNIIDYLAEQVQIKIDTYYDEYDDNGILIKEEADYLEYPFTLGKNRNDLENLQLKLENRKGSSYSQIEKDFLISLIDMTLDALYDDSEMASERRALIYAQKKLQENNSSYEEGGEIIYLKGKKTKLWKILQNHYLTKEEAEIDNENYSQLNIFKEGELSEMINVKAFDEENYYDFDMFEKQIAKILKDKLVDKIELEYGDYEGERTHWLTLYEVKNTDIRFDEGGELEFESLSKQSLEVIGSNYNHIFGFYDLDWNKESERENYEEWLNNFYKKQFNQNLDGAIKKIESDIELIKKRNIVDLKLKTFEELIIPTLGNQVLSPKLSKYEEMVLMNPSATIESIEKGFQEAKNIIDEDGSINQQKITSSNLFQDDFINLPNFERFVKANPEYTGVFNDWKKILDEDKELSLKNTYAFRYPTLEQLEKLHSELIYIKNKKGNNIQFKRGGRTM